MSLLLRTCMYSCYKPTGTQLLGLRRRSEGDAIRAACLISCRTFTCLRCLCKLLQSFEQAFTRSAMLHALRSSRAVVSFTSCPQRSSPFTRQLGSAATVAARSSSSRLLSRQMRPHSQSLLGRPSCLLTIGLFFVNLFVAAIGPSPAITDGASSDIADLSMQFLARHFQPTILRMAK